MDEILRFPDVLGKARDLMETGQWRIVKKSKYRELVFEKYSPQVYPIFVDYEGNMFNGYPLDEKFILIRIPEEQRASLIRFSLNHDSF